MPIHTIKQSIWFQKETFQTWWHWKWQHDLAQCDSETKNYAQIFLSIFFLFWINNIVFMIASILFFFPLSEILLLQDMELDKYFSFHK